MTKIVVETDNLPKRQSVALSTVTGAAMGAVLFAALGYGISKLTNRQYGEFMKSNLVGYAIDGALFQGAISYAGSKMNNSWFDRISSQAAVQTAQPSGLAK